MSKFTEKVLKIVSKIPKGKILSYKAVAKLAGNEKSSRVVGSIMSKNKDKKIPCHRVVRSDGTVGEYNGLQNNKKGKESKIDLLKSEGVKIENGKVIFK
jgi:O-6-methylguanine DNA methyltransferase